MNIKDLTGKPVTIKSPFFGTEEGVQLDHMLDYPFNLIYGQNGSGKSTLAEAFRVASASKTDSSADTPELFSDSSEPIEAAQSLATDVELSINGDSNCLSGERVFVFDEKFINTKIVIAEDEGLKNIITVGDQMISDKNDEDKLKADIEAAKEFITNTPGRIKELKEECETLHTKIHDHVWENYERQMNQILGRSRRSSQETDDVTKYIIEDISDKLKESEVDETRLRARIKEIEGVSSLAPIDLPLLPYSKSDALIYFNSTASMLEQEIQNPVLSERDRSIIELMSGNDYISQAKSIFIERKSGFCPLCQRDINERERMSIEINIRRIERELNRVSENYVTGLCLTEGIIHQFEECINAILQSEDDNLRKVFGRYAEDYHNFANVARDFLEELSDFKSKIATRKQVGAIYAKPEKIDRNHYISTIENFFGALQVLQDKIEIHNKTCADYEQRKNRLIAQCRVFAYIQNKQDIEKYLEDKKEIEDLEAELPLARKNRDQMRSKLRRIYKGAKDYVSVMNFINTALQYIFLDKNRLQVQLNENDNAHFTLYSRGNAVKPCKVSVGERNAIALAYYFASTFSDQRKIDMYHEPTLFVIDDPISSMDAANKAGILSFLKNQFSEIMEGNSFSKIILLSHDLTTVNDIADIISELAKNIVYAPEVKERFRKQQFYEIKNKTMVYRKALSSSYNALIRDIYAYAENGDTSDEDGMGNKMRRFMESYSSFIYNMGVEDMFRNDVILKVIDPEYRQFFRTSASMFLMDKTSHAESRKDSLVVGKIEEQSDDLRKLGKKLLLFILLTNETHLTCMLNEEEFDSVCSWKEDILISDIEGEERHQRTVENLINSYTGIELELEKDVYGNYHCSNCLIPRGRMNLLGGDIHLGRKILIKEVVQNENLRAPFTLFAKRFEIVPELTTSTALVS